MGSFPNVLCVDLADFAYVLAGKNCKLNDIEYQENDVLEDIRQRLSNSGKELFKSSSAIIIFAFDRTFSENKMEYIIEILETLYHHTEKNNEDFELSAGDTGWLSTVSIECFFRVNIFWS